MIAFEDFLFNFLYLMFTFCCIISVFGIWSEIVGRIPWEKEISFFNMMYCENVQESKQKLYLASEEMPNTQSKYWKI